MSGVKVERTNCSGIDDAKDPKRSLASQRKFWRLYRESTPLGRRPNQFEDSAV